MFCAKIADHVIGIDNKYEYIKKYYTDYLTDDAPEFTISVTNEEISAENHDGGYWRSDYLETLAVYRKICERLIFDDIILFHCSALSFGGKAVLFTAPSGTGKSTHARLWRERFGDKITMINDDKPLIKFSDKIYVYGTPYGGKDGIQTNTKAEAAAVVILRQASENSIKKVSADEAFTTLLTQAYRCESIDGVMRMLPLLERFSHIPVYSLGCTISQEAVQLVYDEVFNK